MRILIFLFHITLPWFPPPIHAQTTLSQNIAFQSDEKITYSVFYTVIGFYVNAGTATLTTTLERMDNNDVFHVVGEGKTNPRYDWIFKVRDRYETYFHATELQPLKFIRNVSEGNYTKHEEVTFNHQQNIAITTKGTISVPANIQDVISVVYYARNLDYNKYKKGDKIPFSMYLDNKVYNIYITYLGKENIKTRYGKFRAIKLKPLLVKGNVFDDEEKMTVWVTDDANHIPVRAESPISVGSIKIDLMQFENLRYPLAILR
jgi:hypothetical protein